MDFARQIHHSSPYNLHSFPLPSTRARWRTLARAWRRRQEWRQGGRARSAGASLFLHWPWTEQGSGPLLRWRQIHLGGQSPPLWSRIQPGGWPRPLWSRFQSGGTSQRQWRSSIVLIHGCIPNPPISGFTSHGGGGFAGTTLSPPAGFLFPPSPSPAWWGSDTASPGYSSVWQSDATSFHCFFLFRSSSFRCLFSVF
jgi:hypothetical protein